MRRDSHPRGIAAGLVVAALLGAHATRAQTAAEIIGRGVVSTDAPEFAFTATPDAREVFFTRASADRSRLTIMTATRGADGAWSAATVAPFSGSHRDLDPFVTPDGQRMFFTSDRPRADGTKVNATWVVTRTGNGWSVPMDVGTPLNSTSGDVYVTQARDGTTVFTSNRGGRPGVYLSRETNGRWTAPVRLTFAGIDDAGNPAIAPSGRFLIVVRASAGGASDLFVSCRTGDEWSALRPLDAVNSPFAEFAPGIDAAETTLTFTSERPGVVGPQPPGTRPPGDLYRISLAAAGVHCP